MVQSSFHFSFIKPHQGSLIHHVRLPSSVGNRLRAAARPVRERLPSLMRAGARLRPVRQDGRRRRPLQRRVCLRGQHVSYTCEYCNTLCMRQLSSSRVNVLRKRSARRATRGATLISEGSCAADASPPQMHFIKPSIKEREERRTRELRQAREQTRGGAHVAGVVIMRDRKQRTTTASRRAHRRRYARLGVVGTRSAPHSISQRAAPPLVVIASHSVPHRPRGLVVIAFH